MTFTVLQRSMQFDSGFSFSTAELTIIRVFSEQLIWDDTYRRPETKAEDVLITP